MSCFSLKGRTVLVTGASQGLGLAICETLVEQGAALRITDRHGKGCDSVAEHFRSRGAEVSAWPADLSRREEVVALCDWALGLGPVDALVCNAGIQGPASPLDQADDEDWDTVLEVNLRATARLTSKLIPSMATRGGGSVVLMSSIAGLRGNGRIGLYGVSKAAIAQLARNLAVEWGPRAVRVNAVSPGLIRSPLSAGVLDDATFMNRRMAATPLRRVGEPTEVAGVVAMLCSAAGGFITGQNLVVDGGTLISDGS